MPQANRPFLLAITGGIATGKSTFTKLLKNIGLVVIDTDRIGHSVLNNQTVIAILSKRWGDFILDNGIINRETVASIVFSDRQELIFLNQLVHPMIIREMQRSIDQSTETELGFETALLFETGLQKCFDLNILVTSTNENRLHRLMAKGMDREEALKRINSQMSESKKSELADIVVSNDGDLLALEMEAQRIFKLIKQYKKIEVFSLENFIKANISSINS